MQFTELTDKQQNGISNHVTKPSKTGEKVLSAEIKSTCSSGKINLQKISVDSSTILAKKRVT